MLLQSTFIYPYLNAHGTRAKDDMKEAKIVWLDREWARTREGKYVVDAFSSPEAEYELTDLLNGGWNIVTGGGGSGPEEELLCFVVLARDG